MITTVPGLQTLAQIVGFRRVAYCSRNPISDTQTVNPHLDSVQLPRVRYVLWNIYQINNLFNTYYTGLFVNLVA